MTRAPAITPLTGAQELAARRVLATAFADSVWKVSSWWAAERCATDVIDRLKAEGVELVAVRWPQ